ncbi:MAG: hypothetical protein IT221_07935 [Fluviicola sp.]|jgi:hypothetical protein|nr:hypothetical protein [Fluviicola sp.]
MYKQLISSLSILVLFLFSCKDEDRIRGFSKPKYDYHGSLEPKILEIYPHEIDSIIQGYFENKGCKDSMKITVFFPVVITGDETGYIDTSEYKASVLIMNKKREVWSFIFQRRKTKIDRHFVFPG